MDSYLEDMFRIQLRALELPQPEREYKFHPKRRWRLDFAWPEQRVGVEIEGGTWINGRHNSPLGFVADCEKYNTAALDGWCILRFTGAMLRDGTAADMTVRALRRG